MADFRGQTGLAKKKKGRRRRKRRKDKRRILNVKMGAQGRIQVRLRGGGEFQLVELMYILGENKI